MIGLVLLLVIVSAIIGFLWFKPHRDVAGSDAIVMNASELFKAYDKDPKHADTLYLDKVIEVTGIVASVEMPDSITTSISFKVDEGNTNSIQCVLKAPGKDIAAGQTITVKAVCTGFIADDMLGFKDVKLSEGVVIGEK